MEVINALRPYLVGNSLYNSVISTGIALPFTVLVSYGLYAWFSTSLGHKLRLWAGGSLVVALTLSNLFYLPWQGRQLALQLSDPMTALVVGTIPALVWTVAPIVAFVLLCNRQPEADDWKASNIERWRRFCRMLCATMALLLCNASAPLLITGGQPFNATHTLASWIFTQAWVSGDIQSSTLQSFILCIFVVLVVGIPLLLEKEFSSAKRKRHAKLLLAGMAPLLLVAVPILFRSLQAVDGRQPLFTYDLILAAITAFVVRENK